MKIKQSYIRVMLGVILPLGIVLVACAYIFMPRPALSQTGSSLTGWIWSDTIGWISASCTDTSSCGTSNYGFTVASDGTISGYGWSENIGWVSANASDLAACPEAPCAAKIAGDALTGWLKALSGGSSQSGGWDGWISLEGANYGPTLQDTGYFTGFAWGSDVSGWLDTTLLRTGYEPCQYSYACDGQTIVYRSPHCAITNVTTCTAPAFCAPSSATCLVPGPKFTASAGNLTGHLQVRPLVVRPGNTARAFWNVSNVTGCTVSATNGDSWSGITSGALGTTTTPIMGGTTFTLYCDAYDGVSPPAINESATVSITPIWTEI